MRTVEEHARVIAGLLRPTPAVAIPLADAVGLVLAEDLVATLDLPPFDELRDGRLRRPRRRSSPSCR